MASEVSFQPWRLFHLPLLALFYISGAAAASSISAGRPLSGNSTLLSPSGVFQLGFFSPRNSGRFYVGIWYTVSRETPVWVANRAAPLHRAAAAAELAISGDGNLVLRDGSNALIWSTNLTSPSDASTTAELLDSGNLILRNTVLSGEILWQSFDHPTDTWLPGGKLGMNKLTGEVQKLVSWKNSGDPSPGIFSLEIDPDGSSQYFLLWNSSVRFWSSGLWNGKIFSNVPEMVPGFIYDFRFVSGERETYFTYNTTLSSSVLSRFVVDITGQIKQLFWVAGAGDGDGNGDRGWMQFWSQPRRQCEVYRLCGRFGVCREKTEPHCSCAAGFKESSPEDWSQGNMFDGCERRTPLKCDGDDRFLPVENVGAPAEPLAALPTSSGEKCESACLRDCACTGYSFDGKCSLWHGDLYNLQQLSDGAQDGGRTFYLRLAATEFPSPEKKKKRTAGAIGAGGAAAAVLVILALGLVWRRRRRRKLRELRLAEGALVMFRYSELKRMTKNFSEKLGGGGFGSVFRGIMGDATEVAVKNLEGLGQGEKEFRSEVCTIGTIQHVNLIRLLGFCSDRSRRLLVYDYMPGGSLDRALFKNPAAPLDWKRRYGIILGIARGLAYLHESCRDCIIHCDIKPENILLDGDLVPKVADFGLAKLVGRDFSRVLTTMRGTRGYLAPEWISGEAITAKADVYSFGMMLFEIISGRRNSDAEDGEEKYAFFPSFAAKKMISGEVLDLPDQRMKEGADQKELTRVLRLAFWCAQEEADLRPSFGRVVQILENALEVEIPPIPRFLQLLWENPSAAVEFFGGSPASERSSGTRAGGFSGTSQSTSYASSSAFIFPSVNRREIPPP